MFKHILIPTDGSELSNLAVRQSIVLAKEQGAAVLGLHVIPEYANPSFDNYIPVKSRDEYMNHSAAVAQKYLGEVEKTAKAAGVKCATQFLVSDFPHEAIAQVAQENGCDLIAMASHGRKGLKGLLLGSETQKVLTHSNIPVLVFR